MRALAQDEERVAFWRRHTVSGVVLCVVLPAIVALRTWVAPAPPNGTVVLLLCAAIAVPAPLLLLAPVERLVRHPRGRLFFDAWEAVGIALVLLFCLLDGGVRSPYTLFLFVLLAHAALAYPPVGVALAGSFVVTGYLAVGLVAGGIPAHDLTLVTLALMVTTAVCAFASANHVRVYERTAAYAREIAALAERDGLTGTLNHRAFHERMQLEARRATSDHPVSLLIVDVDEFKTVNDTYGHPAGDGVLVLVGGVLTGLTRPGDSAGRLGGDEFALLLPGTGSQQAAAVAERLREQVRTAASAYGATVSVGLAAVTSPDATALHAAADAATYRAKRSGRNRVVSATEPTVDEPADLAPVRTALSGS
ncbi:diguanylate cyclase (GGDEF)-like protein [Blastococcus colisei]|uniref:Diguanylate cyclase (GGDEF)-like protein n=1 Tax=Blastococcus colisei TaxID=1564162 RepID=A0A543PH25_9ACTN|nr:GGDEF domain-containing protein [Blastococcus colisei]TQN43378.1 diguanylate cyclase (GGDEF)-like protein [Blastococcus colisei]